MSRATSGISATDGIGRRNSTTERVAASMIGTLPSSRPSGTAITAARPSPMAQASALVRACAWNRASRSSVAARPRISVAGGRNAGSAIPVLLSSSMSAAKPRAPVARRRHRVVADAGPTRDRV